MPDLETLLVRIETDLSVFKAGMAEARREVQGFAKETRSTFSGVGDALDLRRFRDQLAASEAAAKQSAERMKKSFSEVCKAQEKSVLGATRNMIELSRGANVRSPQANEQLTVRVSNAASEPATEAAPTGTEGSTPTA